MDVKNHEFMLAVLAACSQGGRDAQLLVVGDGPLRGRLEAQAEALEVADRVTFLGMRDDVPELLSAMDYVLMPSFYEGLPVALIEAQAVGVPALVSEAVTTEADLGLGLVAYQPLQSPQAWHQLLEHWDRPWVSDEFIRARFRARGYDVSHSALDFLTLYGRDVMSTYDSSESAE